MNFLEVVRFPVEWDILEWFYKIGCTFLDYFFYLISEFGSSIAVILIVTLIYWCISKEKGKQIALICFFGVCFNNVLKASFNALRPFEYSNKGYLRKLDGRNLSDGASGTSFPSGHSQNSATLFSSIFGCFKNKIVRIICIALIILIPISRLYLGVHFPGDILIGVLCGILTTVIFSYLFNKYPNKILLIALISLLIIIPFIFLPNIRKDLFKGLGLLSGGIVGIYVEEKYINFKISKVKKVNILRYLCGIIVTGITYGLIHVINHLEFIENYNFLLFLSNYLTHMGLCLVGVVIVPYLFKKIPFLKGEDDE